MKKVGWMAVVVGVLGTTQWVLAENLLPNPGFDAYYKNINGGKHPSSWDRSYGSDNQIFVVSSPKMEGRWATKLLDNGSGSVGLSSSFVEVTPGFNYTASVYARCYDTPSQARMYLRFYDDSGNYLTGTSIGTTSSAWIRLSRTRMAPEGAAYAELLCYVCSGSDTGKVYFDNASLVHADEILSNGAFDGCTTGELPPNWKQWESYNPASVEIYENNEVLWLSDSKTYRSKGAYILLPATPGTPYKCSFSAKKLSASNDNSAFYLIFLDKNKQRFDSDGDGNKEYEAVYVSTTDWTAHEIKVIAPEGTAFIQLLPYYSIAATGVSAFDNIHLEEDYTLFHVSPWGSGTGQTASDPARYTSTSLWSTVNYEAANHPVRVVFQSGNYGGAGSLSLDSLGDSDNRILLKAGNPFGTVFNQPNSTLVNIAGCENMVLEDLGFTGNSTNIGYALRITKTSSGTPSHDIAIKNCHWYGMEGVVYGSSSVRDGSHDVLFENCTFERIGLNTGSHMMYNSYGAINVTVAGCYFENCAGSYVRFRADSDYGVVSNCTFVSTQTYANRSPDWEVFLDFAVFNDEDPGDEHFPRFATITGNTFQFNDSSPADRATIRFYHTGYDPTGWNYLMTAAEGSTLTGSDSAAKKSLLLNNCDIDFDQITIQGNTWQEETARIMFGSYTNYGAPFKGWKNIADVSDIVF